MNGVHTQRELWKRLQESTSPTRSLYRLEGTCRLPVNKHEGGSKAERESCRPSPHEIGERVCFP